MAPPEPQNCQTADCDYSTPEGSNMAQMLAWMELHMKQAHVQQPIEKKKQAVQVKRTRPEVHQEMSEEDWRFFESEWTDYKLSTGLSGPELLSELWTCMANDLKRLAFEQGDKKKLTDENLMMERIKGLAVTVVHTSLHTVQLHEAAQGPLESTKAFAARVRGLAFNCKLVKTCECSKTVSFLDETVYHQVLTGLDDKEMQKRCLSGALLGTIKDTATLVEFCNAEEASSRAAEQPNPLVGSIRSSYRKQNSYKPELKAARGEVKTCGYCDGAPHSGDSREVRSKECTAYGVKCAICFKLGHLTSVCKSRCSAIEGRSAEETEGFADEDSDNQIGAIENFAFY
jgi:hypothetical protein